MANAERSIEEQTEIIRNLNNEKSDMGRKIQDLEEKCESLIQQKQKLVSNLFCSLNLCDD